jgi:hypothetical protein
MYSMIDNPEYEYLLSPDDPIEHRTNQHRYDETLNRILGGNDNSNSNQNKLHSNERHTNNVAAEAKDSQRKLEKIVAFTDDAVFLP